MKTIFLFLAVFGVSVTLHAQVTYQVSQAGSENKAMTAADWLADLRFLQHVAHKDYPFLFKILHPALLMQR